MRMNHRIYPPPSVEGEANPDNTVYHCDNCECCSIFATEDMAIYIDGACSGNGTPNARAGIGAFIYENSPFNVSKPLTNGPQTNQRAEICAAIAALEYVKRLVLEADIRMSYARGVVLITDSAYLVNAMTDWIDKWNKNGWINSSGKPVVNKEDFLELEQYINYLEGRHLRVRFWRVDRKYNYWSDRLAKSAVGL